MRHRVLAVLLSLESAILLAIVVCSLQLSHDISRSGQARALAHAVLATTQHIAAHIKSVTLD